METPKPERIANWLASLPWSSRKAFESMAIDQHPARELSSMINAHVAETHRASETNEFTDVKTCERCAEVALFLATQLEHLQGDDPLLARMAIQYFIENDDGESDLISPNGFDDDLEVLESAVAALGLNEKK